MKTFFVFLGAFLLSAFAGGLVVQSVAVWAKGTEEYILAFAALPMIAVISIVVVWLVYVIGRSRRGLDIAAVSMIAVLALLALAATGFDYASVGMRALRQTGPLMGSIAVGGSLAIAIQWWLVGRRKKRLMAGEG